MAIFNSYVKLPEGKWHVYREKDDKSVDFGGIHPPFRQTHMENLWLEVP